jgi:hypothetical protein
MNKLQKSIGGVVLGVSLTTLLLTGCGKSENEIKLEQQLANYQKKDEQQQQYDSIKSAVKEGVDAAYTAQQGKTKEQLNEIYNKLSTPLASINSNLSDIKTATGEIKSKQTDLENKIKAIPTVTPLTPYTGVSPYGGFSDWQYIPRWQVDKIWSKMDYYTKLDFVGSFTDMQSGGTLWSYWTWNGFADSSEDNGENDGIYLSNSAGIAVIPVTTIQYLPEQYRTQTKTVARIDPVKLGIAITKGSY